MRKCFSTRPLKVQPRKHLSAAVVGGVEKRVAHDHKEMKGRLVNMPIGKVKWYDVERGFGFISYPEGEDCFVGKSVLPKGVTELHRNQRVDFDFAAGKKGPQVLRLQVLDEPRPRKVERKYTPEELGSMTADMISMLESEIQPLLTSGRYPGRKESKKIAGILRAVANELDV